MQTWTLREAHRASRQHLIDLTHGEEDRSPQLAHGSSQGRLEYSLAQSDLDVLLHATFNACHAVPTTVIDLTMLMAIDGEYQWITMRFLAAGLEGAITQSLVLLERPRISWGDERLIQPHEIKKFAQGKDILFHLQKSAAEFQQGKTPRWQMLVGVCAATGTNLVYLRQR